MPKQATLILENGRHFVGYSFGGPAFTSATLQASEVVFNTSMTGYQEILTDPSYFRQIIVMTAAEIGNTGVNDEDNESDRIYAAGLVIRDYPALYSNWRAEHSLSHFLKKHRVPGIYGIDTRELVKQIRETGCLRGALLCEEPSARAMDEIVAKLTSSFSMEGSNLAREVGTATPYRYTQQVQQGPAASSLQNAAARVHLVVVDFGCKRTILEQLARLNADITVVPPTATLAQVLDLRPAGVLLSNGPGDPAAVQTGIELARNLVGNVPILGICLGHQILGLALGLPTFKLKFGHHGGNHPVLDIQNQNISITSQNHNFAVDLEAARNMPGIEITHLNLNDNTLEGFRLKSKNLIAVQFHPEAAPGPHDTRSIFKQFAALLPAHGSALRNDPMRSAADAKAN